MVHFISLLLVFIINSLPLKVSYGIITMPYIAYLAYNRNMKSGIMLFLLGIILTLQSQDFFSIMLFLIVTYGIFYYIFIHLGYKKGNILLMVIIQGLLWGFYGGIPLNLHNILLMVISQGIVNYVYIRGVKQ
ncbi:hypothetical protein [Cetobacterium sp. SF1]|uniref:hypothetical protein n=1 Tax=unclassified Cetobacterium TaxID=2630983 RepID=UPI003CF6FEF0